MGQPEESLGACQPSRVHEARVFTHVPLHCPCPSTKLWGPLSSPSCSPPICLGLPEVPTFRGSGAVQPSQHLPGLLQRVPPALQPSATFPCLKLSLLKPRPEHKVCSADKTKRTKTKTPLWEEKHTKKHYHRAHLPYKIKLPLPPQTDSPKPVPLHSYLPNSVSLPLCWSQPHTWDARLPGGFLSFFKARPHLTSSALSSQLLFSQARREVR